jgi:hypothetical protein
LVAGPSIWISYFFAVYLWAEAACASALAPVDLTPTSVPVMVATVFAASTIAVLGWRAYRLRSNDEHGQLYLWGSMLSVLSVMATLFVGLPAMFLPTC